MQMTPQTAQAAFDRDRDRIVAEWMELLRFPSVSTDPAHDLDCRDCATWLAEHLNGMGFEARLLETPSKPVVFAQRDGKPGKPVVLFYGHYDVQPPDPLEDWRTPPFEPTLADGRLRARGAEDNKGQLFYALKAMEALIRDDRLEATVKIVIEGEEESGSGGIGACLEAWREQLGADILLVTDVFMEALDTPTIILGLRGIVHATVEVSGPRHDLHSGVHGGLAPNPAAALARLLAGLHRADGSVAVEGFYDGIAEPSARERELAASVPFDAEAYRAASGVPPVAGERAFSPVERLGMRPCLDINGLHAGFAGAGVKTIIPARARAKMTARLAAGQDPQRVLAALVAHLEEQTPEGLTVKVIEQGAAGGGLRLDPEQPVVARAAAVLRAIFGREPVMRWEGASIPTVAELARTAGADPLLVGFGLEEDAIHAPNESFSLDQFRLGYTFVSLLLAGL